MKRNFAISSLTFISLLFSTPLFAANIACNSPEGVTIFGMPLEFVSTTPTPAFPATIPLGNTVTGVYTMENNTVSYTMDVTASLTGASAGDATITPSAGCTGLAPGDNTSCTLTVDITPTALGAGSITVEANYTVSGNPSCFDDVTAEISYTAAASTFSYITNSGDSGENNNTVTVCSTGASGALGSCVDSGVSDTPFSTPSGLFIPNHAFSTGDSYYGYVANNGNDTVAQCLLDTSTGLFLSCLDTGSGFSTPVDIAFNTTAGSIYSYVTNFETGDVTKCLADSATGQLGSCATAFSSILENPVGILFQTAGSETYSYVVNSRAQNILQCRYISATGKLVNCFNSGASGFTAPENMAFFNSSADFAYVSDSTSGGAGAVFQCALNDTTGALSSCTSTGSDFDTPMGVILDTVGENDFGFVSNFGDNSVGICAVDAGTGNLTSCANNMLNPVFLPGNIVEQTFNSVNYLYAVNQTVGSLAPTIVQCKIYAPDDQIYCMDAGYQYNVGMPALFDNPTSVEFLSLDGGDIYAYVTDAGTAEVWLCEVDQTTGQFMSCANSGPLGFNAPQYITFGTVNSNQYAYISDAGYSGGTVFQCLVDPVTAELCDCVDSAIDISTPITAVTGVAFEALGGTPYVYVSDPTAATIWQCDLDATTGLFTSCADASAGGTTLLESPAAIVFEEVGADLYLYITSGNGSVSNPPLIKCPVNTSTGEIGPFDACTSFTGFTDTQAGIAFAPSAGVAYVTIQTPSINIQRCALDASGDLSSCGAPFGNPININYKVTNFMGTPRSVVYAVQNGGSGILGCIFDGTAIAGCIDAGTGFQFPSPTSIAFQEVNSTLYAYITDNSLDTVMVCEENASTGLLGNCKGSTVTDLDDPQNITFDPSGTYAYITDKNASQVTECGIDTTAGASEGTLVDCATTATLLNTPFGITFDGVSHAYVVDSGSNIVLSCSVGDNGVLESCVNSGADSLNIPEGIALQTNSTPTVQAYITNSNTTGTAANSTIRCNVDTSTGILSSCVDSGVTGAFAEPTSIAFNSFAGTTQAYVVNGINTTDPLQNVVSKCNWNASTGALSSCVNSEATGPSSSALNNPFGITFFSPPSEE